MKKNLLLFLSLTILTVTNSQSISLDEIGRNYIEENVRDWNLETSDYNHALVSNQYTDEKNQVTHIYYNQTHQGIPVYNALASVHIKDGVVYIGSSRMIGGLSSKINTCSPVLSPEEAIAYAAKHLGQEVETYTLANRETPQKMTFAKASFVDRDIPVELKYMPIENGGVRLAWDLSLSMKKGADYWSMRVDAVNGEILDQYNWTVYCKAEPGMYAHDHSSCGIRQLERHQDSFQSMIEEGIDGASYRVFALPIESPLHGSHELVIDPEYLSASPFGWHDTNGDVEADYTITRGNNVHAYLGDGGSSGDEPDGGDDLIFDFPYDADVEPIDNSTAAVINMFYMNNMLHDLIYQVGFTEAAGNFQQNNYGNGGNGGDYVFAEAADPTISDNASFGTPPDGGNPVMNMGLWTNNGGGLMKIDEPLEIAQIITTYGTANFGNPIEDIPISGSVVPVYDATSLPTQTCMDVENIVEVNGQIALIDRGGCDFSHKVFNAQNAGAVACLICNVVGVNGGTGEETITMGGADNAEFVTIPSLFLPKSTCDLIRRSITSDVVVKATLQNLESGGPSQLDAAFDNGIMAHEFGHGISNRLTAGASNTGCLRCIDDDGDGNCDRGEQMGEGWSDFFALITTVKSGDDGADRRGIGNFAAGQSANGSGIRRFPYSTDMTINPQTYDDIKTGSVPHGVGEVWAGTLWDMYWAFVDLYGWDADWSSTESGNYKAVSLVIEGMKVQPCQPGFVSGRDAILAADQILFSGIHQCMIWDVFARRGIGFYADEGSTMENTDGVENFDSRPQCVEELKITKTVTDFITAGDDVQVALQVINHILSTQTNVVITDEIPTGLSYKDGSASVTPNLAGNMISFDLGDMLYEDDIIVTYTLESDPSEKSQTIFGDNMENGDDFWGLLPIEGSNLWQQTTNQSHSPDRAWYISETADETDQALISDPFTVAGDDPVIRFWHSYNSQAAVDGGFVEVSTDDGFSWANVKGRFIRGGYDGAIAYGTFAIPALEGFSGQSAGFVDSYIDMSEWSGQEIQMRFRFGSDDDMVVSPGLDPGWYVDDFELMSLLKYDSQACVSSDNGGGNCSDMITTIVDSDGLSSGVVDADPDHFTLGIFPNPADDYVSIAVSSKVAEEAEVSLITMDGKLVLKGQMQLSTHKSVYNFDVSSIPTGMYIIKVQTHSGAITEKMVIG